MKIITTKVATTILVGSLCFFSCSTRDIPSSPTDSSSSSAIESPPATPSASATSPSLSSLPTDSASPVSEPDQNLVKAGKETLKSRGYNPLPIFASKGNLGTVDLVDGNKAQVRDAVVIFDGAELAGGKFDLRKGDVFFNASGTTKIKVGEFELRKGECVLFKNKKFTKLELILAAR